MIDALSFTLAVGCVVAAVLAGVRSVQRSFVRAEFGPVLGLLAAGLVVQAVLDVVGLAGGHRPPSPVTHVAYLVVSVIVLPLAAVETRRDDGVWSATLLVVALVVAAVLVVRMQATWRSA